MKQNVRKKLFDYKKRLEKVKNFQIQRVTSALKNGGINVCLLKLPIQPSDEWMVFREENINCPLCKKNKAILTAPAHYWHSTEINCHNCGLHVSDWSPNRLCVKEVKQQWEKINNLELKDIVPFGMPWHKNEGSDYRRTSLNT